MTVGVLIITHGQIGPSLLDTATKVLGLCPLAVETLSIPFDSNPDKKLEQASGIVEELDSGNGVLILTDMYGSTPCNIANRLPTGTRVRVIAGINLPMLIRVLNYPEMDLTDIADKAITGGNDGVLACTQGSVAAQ